MDKKVERYYELKQQQRELERELGELRLQLIAHAESNGLKGWENGEYRVKIIAQERREYDDHKLYEALPDASLWRLLSSADAAKIAGLVKLEILSEASLRNTYAVKQVSALQVEKK
ncbi:hypothetical protein [Cohnella nanjingensis]|uniref:Uncharacterized protein n=1 Tax=Cohnella nanjingensis TaxID=1387779 RepID=A0A7X0RLS0_9BACL|nr:hypothetical protein [Cohnella nanjingensis]MBB6669628.1 hypothetical protein [Cohnella nanjingensis]